MLVTLLKEQMGRGGMSVRKFAKLSGVSHTTVNRMLAGEAVDLSTIQKVCNYLGVDVASALNVDGENSLAHKIALLIQAEPTLEKLFQSAVDDVEAGKISPTDLQEILAYAAYRLKH